MKRIALFMLLVLLAGAVCAQTPPAGQAPPDGRVPPADGERASGGMFAMDPEMLAERIQAEVDIWDQYLTLTDNQKEAACVAVETFYQNMMESFSEGARPDMEAMQLLQDQKAFEIFQLLTADQQALMQYYYEEITTAVMGPGRGPDTGRRQ